jgi:hemolysin activation/secretion protein
MVDQLGRLPSRRAQIDILPGEAVGGSRVQVKGEPIKPWRISLRRDNSGDPSTGEQQWGASLAWDSPLKLADQLTLFGGRDAETGPWRRSNNQGIAYSLPFGWWTFNYGYNQNTYQTRHKAIGFSFETHGESRRHQLGVERILHRDALSKTGASLTLARSSSRNYLEDVLLEVSSHRLAELSLGLNHGCRLGDTLLNLDLGWQRGIGALDAQRRGSPHGTEPDSHYNKYTLTASLLHPLSLAGQSFSLESMAHGQHSEDALFSPQRLSLGGIASVRGFKEQSLGGNSGAYWRNQLRWRHPVNRSLIREFSAALAYDLGAIARRHHQGERFQRLSGHALELTAQGKFLSASLTIARSLERPTNLKREHPVYFNLNLFY